MFKVIRSHWINTLEDIFVAPFDPVHMPLGLRTCCGLMMGCREGDALVLILHSAVLNASSTVASRRIIAASRMRLRTVGSDGRGCQVRPVKSKKANSFLQAQIHIRYTSGWNIHRKYNRRNLTFDELSDANVAIIHLSVEFLHEFSYIDTDVEPIKTFG